MIEAETASRRARAPGSISGIFNLAAFLSGAFSGLEPLYFNGKERGSFSGVLFDPYNFSIIQALSRGYFKFVDVWYIYAVRVTKSIVAL